MSSYPDANPGSNNIENVTGMDTLLDQLRQQNRPVSLDSNRRYVFNDHNSYYGQIQPPQKMPSREYLPPTAPTPPFGHSSHRNSSSQVSSDLPQPRANGGITNPDRTSSLLNLLKFSQPPSLPGNSHATAPQTPTHILPISHNSSIGYYSSEVRNQTGNTLKQEETALLETLMNTAKSNPVQKISSHPITNPSIKSGLDPVSSSPPADTQAYLLQLLNQPSSNPISENIKTPILKQETLHQAPHSKLGSHGNAVDEISQVMGDASHDMGSVSIGDKTAVPKLTKSNQKPMSNSKNSPGIFTYVNPFEGLAASSPRNRPQKSEKPSLQPISTIQILKNPRNEAQDKKSKSGSDGSESKVDIAPKEYSGLQSADSVSRDRTDVADVDEKPEEEKTYVEDASHEVEEKLDEVQNIKTPVSKDGEQFRIEDKLREILGTKTEKASKLSAKANAWPETKKPEKETISTSNDNFNDSADSKNIINKAVVNPILSHVADSWESADAEENPDRDEEETKIKVYNFPMRPWTSIVVKESEEPRPTFRDTSVLDIARLRRDFDQLDRTLVTASSNFITYAMSKNGGVRIIRQDDGKDARLFTETHDRIFNVIISTSSTETKEVIIATGISGTIYWIQLKDGEGDRLEDNHPETYGFTLPPIQDQDSESISGSSKTRARKSSNHPEFFAVSRGKFIYIIFPSIILENGMLEDESTREVNINKYLSHHSIKINTGRAGKDFTFSQDDTMIVSLDKAGRIKFWDIRGLTKRDFSKTSANLDIIESKSPVATFTSISASEKSWPTSILLVDKLRPYQKGGALRYFIVGMKQNHTLQLWDIGLGKPVQEIHLPHTNDSDAICSVVYHAATGMIIIGHPTRNSIYFLHLSAPKYYLSKTISQVEYIEKLANGDTTIPKPDSTAVISGMREYSFASKGELRSLDILSTPSSASSVESGSLFELYCMHSKGVTCLDIRQADLGWNSENKVIHPVMAQNLNLITIESLKEIPPQTEASEVSAQPAIPIRIVPRSGGKETEIPKNIVVPTGNPDDSSKHTPLKQDDKPEKKIAPPNFNLPIPSGPEKMEIKRRRKGPGENSGSHQNNSHFRVPVIDPSSNNRNINSIRADPNQIPDNATQTGISESDIKKVERLFTSSLEKLFQDLRVERQNTNETATANQDAMLRMVSATLNDNIEATLTRIVKSSIELNVIPVISNIASSVVQDQLSVKLDSRFASQLPRELQRSLPDAISHALHQPSLIKLISESLASNVAFSVQNEINILMANTLVPTISNIFSQSTHKFATEIQSRLTEQTSIIEQQRRSDSNKISQLSQLVTGLSETVSSMAAAQTEFQAQFLKVKALTSHERRNIGHSIENHTNNQISRPSTALTGPVEKTREEEEYDNMMNGISAAMNAGDYENAVIQWLQTRREQEFFMNYFSKFSSEFVRRLSPLLLLSLGATISVEFEGEINNDYINQRIAWLETILATFQAHITAGSMDDQVRNLSPKIMAIYRQRFEHLYMRISQLSTHEPILKRLTVLVNVANRIVETARVDERIHEYAGELGGGTPMGLGHHSL